MTCCTQCFSCNVAITFFLTAKIHYSVFTAANQLLLNLISVRQVAFGGFQSDVSLVGPKMKTFFHIHILYICSFLHVDFYFFIFLLYFFALL